MASCFGELNEVLATTSGPQVLAWMSSEAGECTDANETLRDYASLIKLQEGCSWLDLIAVEEREGVCKKWVKARASQGNCNVQAHLSVDGLGDRIWDLLGTPQNEGTSSVEWLFVAAEVQNYPLEIAKHQELRLLRLRRNLDSLPVYAWYASAFGSICFVNRRLADVFGLPKDHPLRFGDSGIGPGPSTQLQLLPANERHHSLARWVHSLRTLQPHDVAFRLRQDDGSFHLYQIRAEPYYDDEGRLLCWSGTCVDVDRAQRYKESLRVARERLRQATRLGTVAETSASIAHEINQPLAAVVSNAHAGLTWLSANPPQIARARQTIERIARDARSTADIMQRMRALFKQESLAIQPTEFTVLSNQIRELTKLKIQSSPIQLHIEAAINLPRILCDPVQVQQVLLNLINNAADAVQLSDSAHKHVWLKCSRSDGNMVLIQVVDNGKGISNLDDLFEPFFTTKEHGMGLGLAISKSIIEANKGSIWAHNLQPSGASVNILLPAESD